MTLKARLEALKPFVRHAESCPDGARWREDDVVTCTCGLAALLANDEGVMNVKIVRCPKCQTEFDVNRQSRTCPHA